VEVDFVGYGASDFWAIEVKHLARVRADDVRGLATFVGDYPNCRPKLLCRETERLEIAGIPCWPVEEILERLRPGDEAVP